MRNNLIFYLFQRRKNWGWLKCEKLCRRPPSGLFPFYSVSFQVVTKQYKKTSGLFWFSFVSFWVINFLIKLLIYPGIMFCALYIVLYTQEPAAVTLRMSFSKTWWETMTSGSGRWIRQNISSKYFQNIFKTWSETLTIGRGWWKQTKIHFNNLLAPTPVSQCVIGWVMLSDFRDGYRIYRACKLVE